MRYKYRITAVLITVFLITSSAISFAAQRDNNRGYEVGDYINNFILTDALTKEKVSFKVDIRGKARVTAILFMTTACSACLIEFKMLHDLTTRYDDFKIVAISVDIEGETTVPAYYDEHGFNATYLLDPGFTVPERFGFIFTPGIVLIDKNGTLLYSKGGFSKKWAATFLKEVQSFLASQ